LGIGAGQLGHGDLREFPTTTLRVDGVPIAKLHLTFPIRDPTSLSVSDLTPNVGLNWYFFTEMFDHFRTFFVGAFQASFSAGVSLESQADTHPLAQMHIAIYVAPLCIRLQ